MKLFAALFIFFTGVANAQSFVHFGETKQFVIDVDLNSIQIKYVAGALKVDSIQRLILKEERAVPGSEKKVAYILDYTTVDCRADTLTFNATHEFAADHEEIESGDPNITIQNPKIEGSFISELIKTMCAIGNAKNRKPVLQNKQLVL